MTDPSLQEIVCCMGRPLAGNPWQFLMERAFEAAGLDWQCLSLDVGPEELPDAMRGLRAMGLRGAHLASPLPLLAAEWVDELGEAAAQCGAVTRVVRQGRRLIGDSGVGAAFVESLRHRRDPARASVWILGAGGAARAVAVALAGAGAKQIGVLSRARERAEQLVRLLQEHFDVEAAALDWDPPPRPPEQLGLVVHATPLGSAALEGVPPLDVEALPPETLVADLVFNPPRTRLLQAAAARGNPTLDGLDSLVAQAAADFACWTGQPADREVLRESLEEYLEV